MHVIGSWIVSVSPLAAAGINHRIARNVVGERVTRTGGKHKIGSLWILARTGNTKVRKLAGAKHVEDSFHAKKSFLKACPLILADMPSTLTRMTRLI